MFTSFFHPLSVFPELLNYQLIAPLFLRLIVGFFILYLAKTRYKKVLNWSAVFYALSALLIIIGLYTQVAVILSIISIKFDFWMDYYSQRKANPIKMEMYFLYAIAGIVLISLLFTGPGFLAFDLNL